MVFEDVKVGQRVRYTRGVSFLEGCVGTCTYISPAGQIAIEFDKNHMALHTCNGHCKDGHGWWCRLFFLNPVEEEVVDNSTPCAPPPVEETVPNRGMSNDQVDAHIARLEDVVETFFTIGVSRQDMLELFNDISKKHFSEKQLRDRIAKIKDKVTKCQN